MITSHEKVFKEIYESGSWGFGSGPGSDPSKCKKYIKFIEGYIQKNNVRSVADLGCGDGRLAKAINWQGASYKGLDVIKGQDIRTYELPKADLAILKDVLQHWSNLDILSFRKRLCMYTQVLITNTSPGFCTNEDISTGNWRSLDLGSPPFNWPVKPVLYFVASEPKLTVEMRKL